MAGEEEVRRSAVGGARHRGAADAPRATCEEITTRWSRAGAAAVLVLSTVVYFRLPLFGGFSQIGGYPSDTRLAVFLHEHWNLVAMGQRSWLEPGNFLPAGDLGSTDTFFLNSVFYVPLRRLGTDPFVAFAGTQMAVSAVGLFSLYVLVRMAYRLTPLVAAVLAATGTYSSALFLQVGHAQLGFVNWVFLAALLAWLGWSSTGPRAAGWAGAAGLVGGLVLFSAFYVAWFTLVAGTFAIGAIAVVDVRRTRLRRVRVALRRRLLQLLAGVAGATLGFIAFLITYLPAVRSGRSRGPDELTAFQVTLSDLVNVGDQNVLVGWLHAPNGRGLLGRESIMGLSPVLLACALLAMVALVVVPRRSGRPVPLVSIGLGAATISLLVLPLELAGVSFWSVLRTFVPGATAIRVPARAWVVAAPLATLLVAAAIASRDRHDPWPRWAGPVAAVIGLLLLASNISTDTGYRLELDDERDLIALGEEMPAACMAFLDAGPTDRPGDWNIHLDAMTIALGSGVGTVNGYSGFEPEGYPDTAGLPSFREDLLAWANNHGVAAGLCSVDVPGRRWSLDPSR